MAIGTAARTVFTHLTRKPLRDITTFTGAKFEHRRACKENSLALFEGFWTTNLRSMNQLVAGGGDDLFNNRGIELACSDLGETGSGLNGFHVLELGALEGAHTYKLLAHGAEKVTAIEGNKLHFLKCLVMKQMLEMDRAEFLLGDFVSYLREHETCYDMIVASGVLYHMVNPLELLKLISLRTDRLYLWTHYYDPAGGRQQRRRPTHLAYDDLACRGYYRRYLDRRLSRFCGGLNSGATWLERDVILSVLKRCGFISVTVINENTDHPNGPSFCVTARR